MTDEKTPIQVRIDSEIAERLRVLCFEQKATKTALILEGLEMVFKKYEKQKPKK